ncbi:tRNA adenosine(34) deaminase TadA [Candidatus Margulisiibacteriota bacterium]
MTHKRFMKQALKEAEKAFSKEEVPVGAVAVVDGKIIARAHNQRENFIDPTAHAEILCIKKAAKKLGSWRLDEVTLYSTLEPCPMCAGAIVHSRIKDLVYGADDPKAGACGSIMNIIASGHLNHQVNAVTGVLAEESGDILKRFFKKLRAG